MKYLRWIVVAIAILLQSCSPAGQESVLDQISGVWKAQNEDTIVTIHTAESRTSFYIDDQAIPVTVGNVDDENKTVNFNVTTSDGAPQIWTMQQVWDTAGKTFHLRATLGNIQSDLSFVRRVSVDDLNRLAAINNPKRTSGVSEADAAPLAHTELAQTEAPSSIDTETVVESPKTATRSFAPSFDCAKVSNGSERLICSDQTLSRMDVELSQLFRKAMACSSDKSALKQDQNTWLRTSRNACSDAPCMVDAYQLRIDDLSTACAID